MAGFATSSVLGVDLNNSSTTALFALNQKVAGSNNSEWQYVKATGTLTTGMCVYVAAAGTAVVVSTAYINAVTDGLDLAFAQFTMLQGEYGFVAKRGDSMYVLCSGTCPGGASLGFAPTSGVMLTAGLAAGALTCAGVFITTSASTATQSVAVATLTYPRAVSSAPLG